MKYHLQRLREEHATLVEDCTRLQEQLEDELSQTSPELWRSDSEIRVQLQTFIPSNRDIIGVHFDTCPLGQPLTSPAVADTRTHELAASDGAVAVSPQAEIRGYDIPDIQPSVVFGDLRELVDGNSLGPNDSLPWEPETEVNATTVDGALNKSNSRASCHRLPETPLLYAATGLADDHGAVEDPKMCAVAAQDALDTGADDFEAVTTPAHEHQPVNVAASFAEGLARHVDASQDALDMRDSLPADERELVNSTVPDGKGTEPHDGAAQDALDTGVDDLEPAPALVHELEPSPHPSTAAELTEDHRLSERPPPHSPSEQSVLDMEASLPVHKQEFVEDAAPNDEGFVARTTSTHDRLDVGHALGDWFVQGSAPQAVSTHNALDIAIESEDSALAQDRKLVDGAVEDEYTPRTTTGVQTDSRSAFLILGYPPVGDMWSDSAQSGVPLSPQQLEVRILPAEERTDDVSLPCPAPRQLFEISCRPPAVQSRRGFQYFFVQARYPGLYPRSSDDPDAGALLQRRALQVRLRMMVAYKRQMDARNSGAILEDARDLEGSAMSRARLWFRYRSPVAVVVFMLAVTLAEIGTLAHPIHFI